MIGRRPHVTHATASAYLCLTSGAWGRRFTGWRLPTDLTLFEGVTNRRRLKRIGLFFCTLRGADLDRIPSFETVRRLPFAEIGAEAIGPECRAVPQIQKKRGAKQNGTRKAR